VWGRGGEDGKRRRVPSKSRVEPTAPKTPSRSRAGMAIDDTPRIQESPRVSTKSPSLGIYIDVGSRLPQTMALPGVAVWASELSIYTTARPEAASENALAAVGIDVKSGPVSTLGIERRCNLFTTNLHI